MRSNPTAGPKKLDLDLHLPVTILARYLFFLSRRPISRSNPHFLRRRLEGLQSLLPLLDGRHPALDPVLRQVESLTPGSFARRVTDLLRQLRPLTPSHLPPEVVVSRRPPATDFLEGVERLAILFAPGIGIGDEILCFPLAGWLRARLPEAHITVCSAYPTIWNRVPAVDQRTGYRSYSDLVRAVRESEEQSLTLVVDFEKPALVGAVASEPGIRRYAEISLGARRVACFDGAARRIHDSIATDPYFANYYDTLRHLASWLGAPPPATAAPVVRRQGSKSSRGEPRLLASPFTSKLDPKESFWSELLAGLVTDENGRPGEVLFDPGPNLATERFARSLARSTRSRGRTGRPLDCRVLQCPGERTLTLAGVFDALDEADIVVCSDSFAAHAAPLFDCLTLVVAQPGLEEWRVPSPNSFYFDSRRPAKVLAEAMRGLFPAARGEAWRPPGWERLLGATRDFEALIGDRAGAPAAGLAAAFTELGQALASVLGSIDLWPESFVGLLDDRPYQQLLPALPHPRDLGSAEELAMHLDSHFRNWHNSNLHKYLALGSTRAAEGTP